MTLRTDNEAVFWFKEGFFDEQKDLDYHDVVELCYKTSYEAGRTAALATPTIEWLGDSDILSLIRTFEENIDY